MLKDSLSPKISKKTIIYYSLAIILLMSSAIGIALFKDIYVSVSFVGITLLTGIVFGKKANKLYCIENGLPENYKLPHSKKRALIYTFLAIFMVIIAILMLLLR